jgi:DNA-binding PadR family transcriptional regulator
MKNIKNAGLVTKGRDNYYNLTDKGKEFLRIFNNYNENYEKIKKQLMKVKNQQMILESMCPDIQNENEKTNIII